MRTLVAILALAADALLIGPKGELLGIGSLIVADADGQGGGQKPGNMFVPIDLLKPILADLVAGRRGRRCRAQGAARGAGAKRHGALRRSRAVFQGLDGLLT